MAFDIFQRFRLSEARSAGDPSFSPKERKKFACYFLYATGTPLIISAITAIFEFSPLVDENNQLKPDFGSRKCFFDQDKKMSNFVLFYLPLLLIQIANLVFFSVTVVKLIQTWRESRQLRVHSSSANVNSNNNSNNYSHSFVVVKVFLIMGINWFFEFLSFLAEWLWDHDMAMKISYFSDMVNLLQGLLIFIVLICKPSVLKKLKDKLIKRPKARVSLTNNVNGETKFSYLSMDKLPTK